MALESPFSPDLIAPCGIDCSLCRGRLIYKNKCPGCRGGPENKSNGCLSCKIVNCPELQKGMKYCFSCGKYPCAIMEHLAHRYRTRYNVDIYQNLKDIKENGIDNFVREESRRWTCPKCNGVISMHTGSCPACEKKKS